jgi:hypothetical protein
MKDTEELVGRWKRYSFSEGANTDVWSRGRGRFGRV